jgi:hypothetical protein
MESITYVNEIDVRKVAVGQPAVVTLDADPSKRLTGKVTAVANVGEQRPNADAKVFEVKVTLEKPDTTLRPGMTTGNAIETMELKDVLFIPLEAVGSDDGIPVAFKRTGNRVIKQEIETGVMNDDEVVVVRGLGESDEILIVPPADADQLPVQRLPGSRAQLKSVGGDTAVTTPMPSAPDGPSDAKAKAPAPAAPKSAPTLPAAARKG